MSPENMDLFYAVLLLVLTVIGIVLVVMLCSIIIRTSAWRRDMLNAARATERHLEKLLQSRPRPPSTTTPKNAP